MRRHLTYANVMVTLLAIGALTGGVAYAANTIFSTDIVNGEVKSVDIGTGQVQTADVKNESLTGHDIQDDTIGGADVNESLLDVVQGRGTLLSNRLVTVPTNLKPLLTIPGLGELQARCTPVGAEAEWVNTTSSTIDFWHHQVRTSGICLLEN